MNILTNKLPESVTINNAEVPINWDFRVSIEFTELMENAGNYEKNELLIKALQLYYPNSDDFKDADLEDAFEQLMWFYRCGKPEKDEDNSKKIMSYEYDSGHISAAFLEQYQIDFQLIDTLHWWKFRSLFESLKDDTEIMKIMGYRGIDTKKMSKEEKSFYAKMKRLYALPDEENILTKEEKAYQEELNTALSTGGDVMAVMKKYGKE